MQALKCKLMLYKAEHKYLNMTVKPDFFFIATKNPPHPKKPNPPPRINTQGDLRHTMHMQRGLSQKKKKKKKSTHKQDARNTTKHNKHQRQDILSHSSITTHPRSVNGTRYWKYIV